MEYAEWSLCKRRQASKCMPNDDKLKTGKNDINVFIFFIKQRTDQNSPDNECNRKTEEQGRTTWTNKKTEHLKMICIRIVHRQKVHKNFEEALVGVCDWHIKEYKTLKIPVYVH